MKRGRPTIPRWPPGSDCNPHSQGSHIAVQANIARFDSPALFCIKVGTSETPETFYAHEHILRTSSYFASLIDGSFIESTEMEVTLREPVDNPQAFKYILSFLYNEKREYTVELDSKASSTVSTAGVLHARIFLMANRLCMEDLEQLAFNRLKDCLNDEMFRNCTNYWKTNNLCTVIELVFCNTCAPSPPTSFEERKIELSR